MGCAGRSRGHRGTRYGALEPGNFAVVVARACEHGEHFQHIDLLQSEGVGRRRIRARRARPLAPRDRHRQGRSRRRQLSRARRAKVSSLAVATSSARREPGAGFVDISERERRPASPRCCDRHHDQHPGRGGRVLDLVERRERRGGVARNQQPFAGHLAQHVGVSVQRLASGELVGGEHRIRRGRRPAVYAVAFPIPRHRGRARVAAFRQPLLGSIETVRSSSEVTDVVRGHGCPDVRVERVLGVRQDGPEAFEFVDVGVRQGRCRLVWPP